MSDSIEAYLKKENYYTINIKTTRELLLIWMCESRILYTFTGRSCGDSNWGISRRAKCCFCRKTSKYYLFEGYHSHYCSIDHPVSRGIIKGGEVNVCEECFETLLTMRKDAKQFVMSLLTQYWSQYLTKDVAGIICGLFEKAIRRSHPSIFRDL
jgi:hypothetical protein